MHVKYWPVFIWRSHFIVYYDSVPFFTCVLQDLVLPHPQCSYCIMITTVTWLRNACLTAVSRRLFICLFIYLFIFTAFRVFFPFSITIGTNIATCVTLMCQKIPQTVLNSRNYVVLTFSLKAQSDKIINVS